MDCTMITGELVGYQLGALDERRRDEVEKHLLGCSACLRAYLGLKRAMDEGGGERPRAAVRKRLRDEVARTFRPSAASRTRTWLARPVPLYQVFAAAAVVLVAVGVIGPQVFSSKDESAPPPVAVTAPPVGPAVVPASVTRVDTARLQPESLDFY